MYRHPYHLVDLSPWPLAASAAVFAFALSMIGFMTTGNSFWSLVALIVVAVAWWRDVIRESAGGFHTRLVVRGIMIGALLFYLSEIMLFFSFFWANLHSALSPGVELANSWPPRFVQAVDPWAIPFLGSLILLASGFTFTLAHLSFGQSKSRSLLSMIITLILGLSFLLLQFTEYRWSSLTIADGVFGSAFYMTTGLHALHVIIGVLFLSVAFVRIARDSFTTEHHNGLNFAGWYWHLVDVVWLAVFVIYYVWIGF